MLIFLIGVDTCRSQKKLSVMRERFLEKFDPSGMNVQEFDGAKAKLGDVAQAISSVPFLSEKRMVIVKGLLTHASTKPDAVPWSKLFQSVPDSTICILQDDVSVKKGVKHTLVKEFSDTDDVHVYQFPTLEGAALVRFAEEEARRTGLRVDRVRLQDVVRRVGPDTWQLRNEIGKLAAYMEGEPLTIEAIELLVRSNASDQMFPLMDAASVGNAKKALELLSTQRKFGTGDGQLIGMLARQIRLLLAARTELDRNGSLTKQEFAKILGVHPFVAQKTLASARAFSAEALEELHECLYVLDAKAKRGGVSMEVAVDRTVAKMITLT